MKKTPKLRFKEFSGDWKSKYGESIAEKITKGSSPKWQGFNYQSEGVLFVTSENVRDGYLDISEPKYLPLEFNEKQKSSSLAKGDILINIVGASIGRVCEFNLDNVVANVNQAVCVFRLKDKAMKNFINYHLQTNKTKKVLFGTQTESARPNLSLTDIRGLEFNVPKTKEEQDKIASFFSLIDDKISLQGEKVEALKNYKKGMMQKIFSRELRFKDDEGRDYPEWEEKKIKDIFNVTRGVVIAKTEISDSEDEVNKYPVYSSQTSNNGILGYDSGYDFEGDYLTWTTDGANAGKVFRRSGKFRCTNVCGVLVENDETIGFANKMISEILNKETPKHVSYVGNPKLMNGVMGDIKIKVPVIDEQIKIAKALDSIDLKIEKEKEKLDSLNEYKRGLLQQMFV